MARLERKEAENQGQYGIVITFLITSRSGHVNGAIMRL